MVCMCVFMGVDVLMKGNKFCSGLNVTKLSDKKKYNNKVLPFCAISKLLEKHIDVTQYDSGCNQRYQEYISGVINQYY